MADDKTSEHIVMSRRRARQRLADIHVVERVLTQTIMDENIPMEVRSLLAHPVLQNCGARRTEWSRWSMRSST